MMSQLRQRLWWQNLDLKGITLFGGARSVVGNVVQSQFYNFSSLII
jgi:hypothetical protein